MNIKINTFWNLFGSILPLIVGILVIPMLIKHAGLESFGVLTLIWALIGYFSFFEFGIGRALTQRIAYKLARKDGNEIVYQVRAGLLFALMAGIIGGMVVASLAEPLALRWLKISEPLQEASRQSFLIAAFGIPLATLTGAMKGVVEGFEEFAEINIIRVFLGMANFGFPLFAVILLESSIQAMVVSLIVARILAMGAHLWLMFKKINWRTLASTKVRANDFRDLLKFGLGITVSNIVSPLMTAADRFFISASLGAAVVPSYTVPSEAIQRILIIPGAFAGALYPRFSSEKFEKRRTALYRRSIILTILLMLIICVPVGLAAKAWLTLWVGEDLALKSWMVALVLSIGMIFNGIAQIPYASVQARGDSRSTATLHLIEALFFLPILYFAIREMGVVGAALAWSIRALIDLMLLIYIESRHGNTRS